MQNLSHALRSAFFILLLLAGMVWMDASGAKPASKKNFVVVIDAGHGGKDVGATEYNVQEKDVNLAVALKLGNLIKKKLKDTEVVYTRDGDYFVTLQKRADIANAAKADLFVSIHCNSVDLKNPNRANVVGASTYILGHHKDQDNLAVAQRENAVVELDANDAAHFSEFDPSKDESVIIFSMTQKKNFQNSARFAKYVQDEMAKAGRTSRGVHQAGFWVLWSTAMPAALVELDFICNPEQAKFMGSNEGQENLAGAIFNAVKTYESYFRSSLGATSVEPDDLQQKKAVSLTEASQQQKASSLTDAVELPATTELEEPRRHRLETGSQTAAKPTTVANSSHRRSSASARKSSSEGVEQATFALASEAKTNSVSAQPVEDQADKRNQASASKNSQVQSSGGRAVSASSQPARRDKTNVSKKRAVKKNLNVVYKVLLFSSDDVLQPGDDIFKGLSPISSHREQNKYRYTYGESEDLEEMVLTQARISDLFPEARVIKCYN